MHRVFAGTSLAAWLLVQTLCKLSTGCLVCQCFGARRLQAGQQTQLPQDSSKRNRRELEGVGKYRVLPKQALKRNRTYQKSCSANCFSKENASGCRTLFKKTCAELRRRV